MISQFKRLLQPRVKGTTTTVAEGGIERDRMPGHGDGERPSGSAAGAESRGMFSALRHRNFRLFFFGQLISLTGTWMDITAEGWLVYKLTGSKLLLGVVGVASSAPPVPHRFNCISVRRCPGVRYALATIIFHRDDQPG